VNARPPIATLNRNAHQLEVGAARLGWAAEAMHRNVRGCANLGLCNLGCPSGAKLSALVTWVPDAEARGARVVPLARADRIEVAGGSVRAVQATRLDPHTRQPGRTSRQPRGVRRGGRAGYARVAAQRARRGTAPRRRAVPFERYVSARFREPVLGFYGPTMAYAVTEWSDVNGQRGPGFMLENVTVAPSVTASSLPGFGAEHERVMEALPHLARAVVVLRDRTRGSVAIDGAGAPALSYQPVAEDLARIREAVKQLARLYLAAGATEVYLPVNGLAAVRSKPISRRSMRAFDRTLAARHAPVRRRRWAFAQGSATAVAFGLISTSPIRCRASNANPDRSWPTRCASRESSRRGEHRSDRAPSDAPPGLRAPSRSANARSAGFLRFAGALAACCPRAARGCPPS
jgi:hypothetical protein